MTALTCAQSMAHVWVGTASVILVTMVMTAGEEVQSSCVHYYAWKGGVIPWRACLRPRGRRTMAWYPLLVHAGTDIPRNMWIREILSKNFQLRALHPAGMISRRWNMDCLVSHGLPSIPTIHAMTRQLWNHVVFHILACQLHVPVNQWNVSRVEDRLCIQGGIQVGQV